MAEIHKKVLETVRNIEASHPGGASAGFTRGTSEHQAALDLVKSGQLVSTGQGWAYEHPGFKSDPGHPTESFRTKR